jgi:hypothetical protein
MGTSVSGVVAPERSAFVQLDDAAYCDLGNSLPISFLGVSPYCFEGWFNFDGLCPDSVLLSKPGEFTLGTKGATIYVQRTGQIFPLQTQGVLKVGEWTHIAVAFDGVTIALFVDGLMNVSSSSPGPGVGNKGQNFVLGSGFQGEIDSFRIWSLARSQTQIYTSQWVTLGSTAGLVAEYDCSRTPPADVSGNGHPITLRNGALSIEAAPVVRVTGAGYCEPVEDAALVNPGGGGSDAYTITAWVNVDYIGSGKQCVFANGDFSTAKGVFLLVSADGTVSAQRGGSSGAIVTSTNSLQVNQWYHLACTYDGTTQSLYVNGVLEGSAAAPALGTMPQGDLSIAAAFSSQSTAAIMTLQGYLQFVSIWSKCLTASEVKAGMYEDPTDETGVTANYSFVADAATNLQTNNPIGLAAGAALTQLTTSASSQDAPELSASPPLRPAPRPLTAEDLEERSAFYTPETRAAFVEEYRRSLPPHMPRAQRTELIESFETTLAAIASGDPDAGLGRQLRFRLVQDGDAWSFRELVGAEEVEVARRPLSELTPCQAAEITFLIATFDLFLGLLGLVMNTSVATRFFNLRVGEAGVETALKAIFSLSLTPASILKVIAILWDFGWFTALAQLAISGLTWWDCITLLLRVASMIVPYPTFQKAYMITQIGIGLWEVGASFLAAHNACLPGGELPACC